MRGILESSVFNSVGMFYDDNDNDDDNDDVSLNRFGSYRLCTLINYNYFTKTVQIFVPCSKIIVIPFYFWTRKGVDVSDVPVKVHTVQKWKKIELIFIKSWGD